MKFQIPILVVICTFGIAPALVTNAQESSNQSAEPDDSIENANDVKIVFRNTTENPVRFQLLATSGEFAQGVPVHEDFPLPRNRERTYESKSGLVWEVLNRRSKVVAQYISGNDGRQVVDIKELISWQSKIQINFQNSTDKPVDIFWTSPEGIQTLIVDDMPPGTEMKDAPLSSLPNQLWTIEQEGEFFADYFPNNESSQDVDLTELKTWFEPVEITFNNTTDMEIHIYLVGLDGQETKYGGDEPLVNARLIQPANPLTIWMIKDGDNVIAEYVTTNEKTQNCNLTYELLNTND